MEIDEARFESRVTSPESMEEDFDLETTLRPQTLREYVGQETVKENLAVYMEAAKRRGEQLDSKLIPNT